MITFSSPLADFISYILLLGETAKTAQNKTKTPPKKPPTPSHSSQAIHDSTATCIPCWRTLAHLVVPYKAVHEQTCCSSPDILRNYYTDLKMKAPERYKLFSVVAKLQINSLMSPALFSIPLLRILNVWLIFLTTATCWADVLIHPPSTISETLLCIVTVSSDHVFGTFMFSSIKKLLRKTLCITLSRAVLAPVLESIWSDLGDSLLFLSANCSILHNPHNLLGHI